MCGHVYVCSAPKEVITPSHECIVNRYSINPSTKVNPPLYHGIILSKSPKGISSCT